MRVNPRIAPALYAWAGQWRKRLKARRPQANLAESAKGAALAKLQRLLINNERGARGYRMQAPAVKDLQRVYLLLCTPHEESK